MASKKKGSDEPVHVTARILAGIRTDLNAQGEALRRELVKANERLERLERRQTEADVHVATELTALIGAIGDLKSTLVAEVREVKAMQAEMRADGARMNALEARLARLEAKAS